MIAIIIFILSVAVYVPLAASLLYVWWKYGRNETKVALARIIFLIGSFALFGLMTLV